MRRLTRNLPLILVAVLVIGGLAWSMRPRPLEVELGEVSRGRIVVTVDEDGQTRVRERYIVSAPLSGRVRRIELDPGDPVTAGETVLAVLEPTDPALLDPRQIAEAEARVRAAQAASDAAARRLSAAEAELEMADNELRRISDARARGGATEIEFERATSLQRARDEARKAAAFTVSVAQYELALAQAAFVRTRPLGEGEQPGAALPILSPITGRVLRVIQESAAVVSPGASLVEVGDPADLEVVIDVLSQDAVAIAPGAPVELVHWGGDKPIAATVRLVEPAAFTKVSALGVDEQRVNVIIDFAAETSSEQRAALGDAYRVEARIVTWEKEDAVRVPVGAMFRRAGAWHVFAVTEGRASLRPVEIGRRGGEWGEVLSGLQPGDTVIVYPSDSVADGAPVRAWKQ